MIGFSVGKHAFHDAVNMIHDIIMTAYPSPYTAKFKFVGVRNKNSTNQTLKDKQNMCIVLSYIKII